MYMSICSMDSRWIYVDHEKYVNTICHLYVTFNYVARSQVYVYIRGDTLRETGTTCPWTNIFAGESRFTRTYSYKIRQSSRNLPVKALYVFYKFKVQYVFFTDCVFV